VSGASASTADPVRRVAAEAWLFRWGVEVDAGLRFERLAERLAAIGAARSIVALARRSARDERRHAEICARLAEGLGASVPTDRPAAPREIVPTGLLARGQVLYEVVAACCITETESMSVLTTLLAAVKSRRMRAVLRRLASDEVRHSRLGWAHLASEHAAGVTSFLGPLVPAMLQGSAAPDLFEAVSPAKEDAALLEYGVVPHGIKREVFARTLEDVVFPGLQRFGVDTGPGRAWLASRRRHAARADPRSLDPLPMRRSDPEPLSGARRGSPSSGRRRPKLTARPQPPRRKPVERDPGG